MRALLIGDIHAEDALLAAAIAHARDAGVDRLLSVGDVVDGPRDADAAIALLVEHGFDVVRGNHERWVLEGRPLEPFDYPESILAWMRTLPATREYETPTGRLLLGHGIGDDDMARLQPHTEGYALECLEALSRLTRARRYRWLVGGHTHDPMVRTIDGLTVVNPGTLVATEDPGFMIADFARADFQRWAFGAGGAILAAERWQLTGAS